MNQPQQRRYHTSHCCFRFNTILPSHMHGERKSRQLQPVIN